MEHNDSNEKSRETADQENDTTDSKPEPEDNSANSSLLQGSCNSASQSADSDSTTSTSGSSRSTTTSISARTSESSTSCHSNSSSIAVVPEAQEDAPGAIIVGHQPDDEEPSTPFEDARSHTRGWFSSRENSFNNNDPAADSEDTCHREFATPAAPSGETSFLGDEGLLPPSLLPHVHVNDPDAAGDSCYTTVLLMEAAAADSVTDDQAPLATASPDQVSATPQPSSTSTPSPPRTAVLLEPQESPMRAQQQQQQQQQQQTSPQRPPARPRVRTVAPRGVYGGPGTAYPSALLKRRLAAFPVVVPEDVDPTVPPPPPPPTPGGAADLADLLTAWEAAETSATEACGVCRRPADRPGAGGFLGYPVCACPHVHSRCVLVCALLSAPSDTPECPGCSRRLRIHRVGRVKPGRGHAPGPMREPWFALSMATGLSTAAALLAVSVALLLTLVEPEHRSLMSAANQPLLAGLFCLLGASLLSCFLIGWLLDRCTAAAWELYSSRLQIAYCPDRLSNPCELVLAASLMACTFLDYRAAGYPYPKRPSAFVNYFCLRQPVNSV